ncbi:lipoprotein, putative [Acidithiobacillus ferrooxidans ATCC 23270]|uniref:Lipoprotein, putative n=1 Tax=Acidithiobacillus ferrooxidans (strain ATCC 23270 / DSM 14882 / CIP 104768 / NCIMB 8455) TaxID=243159 RepID=B7J9F7_ACIF2|nr:lipoprotein, putative [Acidithiobacillus ferrooxidans ATCC 23270]
MDRPLMGTLQSGVGCWFGEQPGRANRVYFELLRHLPWADITAGYRPRQLPAAHLTWEDV